MPQPVVNEETKALAAARAQEEQNRIAAHDKLMEWSHLEDKNYAAYTEKNRYHTTTILKDGAPQYQHLEQEWTAEQDKLLNAARDARAHPDQAHFEAAKKAKEGYEGWLVGKRDAGILPEAALNSGAGKFEGFGREGAVSYLQTLHDDVLAVQTGKATTAEKGNYFPLDFEHKAAAPSLLRPGAAGQTAPLPQPATPAAPATPDGMQTITGIATIQGKTGQATAPAHVDPTCVDPQHPVTKAKPQPAHTDVDAKYAHLKAELDKLSVDDKMGVQKMLAEVGHPANAANKKYGELGDGVDGKIGHSTLAAIGDHFKSLNDLRIAFTQKHNKENPGNEVPFGTRPETVAFALHTKEVAEHNAPKPGASEICPSPADGHVVAGFDPKLIQQSMIMKGELPHHKDNKLADIPKLDINATFGKMLHPEALGQAKDCGKQLQGVTGGYNVTDLSSNSSPKANCPPTKGQSPN